MVLHDFAEFLTASKSAIDIFKALRAEVPSGPRRARRLSRAAIKKPKMTLTNFCKGDIN